LFYFVTDTTRDLILFCKLFNAFNMYVIRINVFVEHTTLSIIPCLFRQHKYKETTHYYLFMDGLTCILDETGIRPELIMTSIIEASAL
jgi:hypothetical protein